jgi:NAD dependent epimerase/dehydratase family enzyme
VHNEDAVRLYRDALDDDRLTGPINLAAPGLLRQREVAQELGRALRRPARIRTPAPLLRGLLGEQADLLLHGQRASSLKLDDVAFRYPTLQAALEEALR